MEAEDTEAEEERMVTEEEEVENEEHQDPRRDTRIILTLQIKVIH